MAMVLEGLRNKFQAWKVRKPRAHLWYSGTPVLYILQDGSAVYVGRQDAIFFSPGFHLRTYLVGYNGGIPSDVVYRAVRN